MKISNFNFLLKDSKVIEDLQVLVDQKVQRERKECQEKQELLATQELKAREDFQVFLENLASLVKKALMDHLGLEDCLALLDLRVQNFK